MTPNNRVRRYGFALLVLVLGEIIFALPDGEEMSKQGGIIAFFAILLTAWYGGFGPGMLTTTAVSAIVLRQNWPKPDYLRVVEFLSGGLAISLLAETLHAARRQAEVSQRALAAVLRSIGDAVITTDVRGRITFINPVATELTGWEPDEAAGRSLEEVFKIANEDTLESTEDPVARVMREGTVVGLANHTFLIARNGKHTPIHDSAAPIRNAANKIVGAVLVFRDDTDRRNRERELQEANRHKDEFLAMLGHELRNPLAAVRSAVEILDIPAARDQWDWARGIIRQQTEHLAYLLDDLLDVSRIMRGLIRVRPRRIDASTIIEQAVDATRPLIDERKHRLDLEIEPGPLPLEADPDRLEQILINLLSNAAKYTPVGGRIALSAGLDDGQVVLKVRDNGVGISPQMLPQIFDLFTQGARSLDRSEGGLGVGLTIVKQLVDLHGGAITAASEGPGRGSEFTVKLPAVDAPPAPPGSRFPAPKRGRRFRILIVDDNQPLAQGLCSLLNLLGHEVEVAFDGPAGLEAARLHRPEVVLLDIGLPYMDGYEVARQLRDTEELKDVLIIAISGYGQEEDRKLSRAAGIDHHLTKPVDVTTIEELMTRSQASASANSH